MMLQLYFQDFEFSLSLSLSLSPSIYMYHSFSFSLAFFYLSICLSIYLPIYLSSSLAHNFFPLPSLYQINPCIIIHESHLPVSDDEQHVILPPAFLDDGHRHLDNRSEGRGPYHNIQPDVSKLKQIHERERDVTKSQRTGQSQTRNNLSVAGQHFLETVTRPLVGEETEYIFIVGRRCNDLRPLELSFKREREREREREIIKMVLTYHRRNRSKG